MGPVKVLIVDDSAVVRQVLTEQLNAIGGIQVIGCARDPIFAKRLLEKTWPDVILLDIEMPRMDGITFLRHLMQERPTPVIICSTLTERGAEVTMQALRAGAVDIIAKPKLGLRQFLEDAKTLLGDAIKGASHARVDKIAAVSSQTTPAMAPSPRLTADAVVAEGGFRPLAATTERVVAIGASTGGTQALEYLLTRLPRTAPGIVLVQHMPGRFTAAFATRLNQRCQIEVREAQDGDRVIAGLALIAPGTHHLLLKRSGAQYRVAVKAGPLVSRHRPSVDVLFRSTAQSAGPNALGVILTGMGDDGARGLLEMHEAGAFTVAQDEQSCVVYGMPKEAVKLGGVDTVVGLHKIPDLVAAAPSRKQATARRP